jgi:hypothetical protein
METMSTHKNELAIVREQQLAALRTKAGKPERLTLRFACAAQDIEFQVTFARLPPAARFTCETIDPSKGRTSPLARLQGLFRPAETFTVPAAEMDLRSVACACARPVHWILCNHCGAFVCNSRSDGATFICRRTCGGRGETVPLRHVNGAKNGGTEGLTALPRAQTTRLLNKRS